MKKVFYSFEGLPGQWVSSEDKSYPESYFSDKKYDEYVFHDFFEMDNTIGLENTIFGTRGLPIGHPKRTSRSFDQYYKSYGPAIVRVINSYDDRLQEEILWIKKKINILMPLH